MQSNYNLQNLSGRAEPIRHNIHPYPHTLEYGGDCVEGFVLGNSGEYKIKENESGSKALSKYNATHGMSVQLQFTDMESGESLEALITETLTGEYLKNVFIGDIDELSKHLLTSGEIGVTIPSTKEREG